MSRLTKEQRRVLVVESGDYIRRGCIGNHWHLYYSIQAILREEERLRAEVKDLKARLKACRDYMDSDESWSERAWAATDLRVKNWRKP